MKKLILFIIILIGLSSCDSTIKKVENPEELTTIHIQNLKADTMLVAIDKDILYAINKDTKLVGYILTNISLGEVLLLIFAGIVLGGIIILLIIES